VRRLARSAVASIAVVAWALAACGVDEPAEFTDNTRTNVLAACVDDEDPAMVGDICACAYRTMRTRLSFERFEEVDRQLRTDLIQPLPRDVVAILAECVIEVGDL
jgi:predicted small lipoprotein YifL